MSQTDYPLMLHKCYQIKYCSTCCSKISREEVLKMGIVAPKRMSRRKITGQPGCGQGVDLKALVKVLVMGREERDCDPSFGTRMLRGLT